MEPALIRVMTDADWQLFPKFKKDDFACRCPCRVLFVSYQTIVFLDAIQKCLNCDLIINRGGSCTAHNKAVGGTMQSFHIALPKRGLPAMAVDFVPIGLPLSVAYNKTDVMLGNTGGLILEPTWIHMDSRKIRYRETKRN